MPTIGGLPKNIIYIDEGKFYKFPHYIILSNNKEDAEKELRRYMLNLQLAINFFKSDSVGSADWLVKHNNRYIKSYEDTMKIVLSDLNIGCKEVVM